MYTPRRRPSSGRHAPKCEHTATQPEYAAVFFMLNIVESLATTSPTTTTTSPSAASTAAATQLMLMPGVKEQGETSVGHTRMRAPLARR